MSIATKSSSSQGTGSADAVNNRLRAEDFYGGDFVEDGSFLVLNTDGLSLSPSTPPEERSDDEKNMDIEVLNGIDDDDEVTTTQMQQSTTQVLGEDLESSVDSGDAGVKTDAENQKTASLNMRDGNTSNSGTMSLASGSSTDTHLIESSEEVNIVMAENKKLAELLADSNEKMKQCITTTEKLKADHEDYKKKHEASRDVIVQLRHDNDMLKSQISTIQSRSYTDDSQTIGKEVAEKEAVILQQSQKITDLNDQIASVLTVNGQLNDDLQARQKDVEEMQYEIQRLRTEAVESAKKLNVMRNEIDAGRQTMGKFNEHRLKNENDLMHLRTELVNAGDKLRKLEATVEEKTKLTDSLRRNMEDSVNSLERCNQKLNRKEQEISLLTTQIAAFKAESDNSERVQVLEMQCQTYFSDFEKERDERARLAAEKEDLLRQLHLMTQQVKEKSDALDNYRRQYGDAINQGNTLRNENSVANPNDSLPSPLTSLPSVAGHLVGFVRRELLGWEDQNGGSADANQSASMEASGGSEAVVQQPKQEGIPPCPICRKTFSTVETLQRHASNCGISNYDSFGGHPEDESFVFP